MAWNEPHLPALIADDLGISRVEPDMTWREHDAEGHEHFWLEWSNSEDGPPRYRVVNAACHIEEFEDYPSTEWYTCVFCRDEVHPRYNLVAVQTTVFDDPLGIAKAAEAPALPRGEGAVFHPDAFAAVYPPMPWPGEWDCPKCHDVYSHMEPGYCPED